MNAFKKTLKQFFVPLAILSVVFNLTKINVFRKEIFMNRKSFSALEYIVLIGFVIILLFIILSILWLIIQSIMENEFNGSDIMMVFFGLLCFVLLFGEKVISDEIAREMKLGWETQVETVILNLFILIQLVYIYLFKRKLRT